MGRRDWAGTVLVACLIAAVVALVPAHIVLVWIFSVGAVVSAGVVVWDVRTGRQPKPPMRLDRVIADARAILGQMSPQEALTSPLVVTEWEAWEKGTLEMLRQEFGPEAAREFYGQRARYGRHPAIWIPKQIEVLEALRGR